MNVLGIIPARGGSKAVPRKNIRLLNGRPLIAHTIEQAASAQMLTSVVVSTDDDEIAQVAREYGAEAIMRPAYLALDDTPMLPVLLHALEYVGRPYDVVVILQPTSPLRTADDIDRSVHLLLFTGADTVVTISRVSKASHPLLAQRIDGNRLHPFLADRAPHRAGEAPHRQGLPPVVRVNGAVYAIRRETLVVENRIIGNDVRGVWMESSRSIDIDTEEDLFIAEALIQHSRSGASPGRGDAGRYGDQAAVLLAADAWEKSVSACRKGLNYDEWAESTLLARVRGLRGGSW